MPTEPDPTGPEPFDSLPSMPPERREPAEVAVPAEIIERASRDEPPVGWREIVAVLLVIVLADLTVYRGHGFGGYAALFLFAPIFLAAGSPRPGFGLGFWLVGAMLVLLAAKMLWLGSGLLAACGLVLLVAFAMALSGLCPYVLETAVFASQTMLAGYAGLIQYRRRGSGLSASLPRGVWADYGLPAAALVAFGLLFIVANPDLLASFGETVESVVRTLREWILHFAPTWQEMLFWLAVLWATVGLLRPVVTRTLLAETPRAAPAAAADHAPAPLYAACRNTLVTVIVLFAVYLVYEFQTLWFREFEPGFYYSGYAHEGAAWLTVALALATVVLSLIFRGRTLGDRRLRRLRGLAWIWSAENMLLAVAVYHRLYIYIGFNGMTRMRTVGLFGMTCVVVGFILVLWKIVRNRDFVWLLRRHLWTVALAVYLYALVPVDALVHAYNVRRILAGDPAPSVEISEHPISAEGVLVLLPLTDCEDEIIREGVKAMLAERLDEAEALADRRQELGWATYQIADRIVLDGLREEAGEFAPYVEDRPKRNTALARFREYAYQWY